MAKAKDDTKDTKEFPKKWFTKLPEGYANNADSKSTEDLESDIMTATSAKAQAEEEMEADQKLNVLKEDVKLLQSGYTEVIKAEEAKVRYNMHVLRNRGAR